MGKDGTYETDFEIGIFAKLYKRKVCIWISTENKYTVFGIIEPETIDEKVPINILFTGHLRSGHFDFLKIVNRTNVIEDNDVTKENS